MSENFKSFKYVLRTKEDMDHSACYQHTVQKSVFPDDMGVHYCLWQGQLTDQ